jgi:hypothetical protein
VDRCVEQRKGGRKKERKIPKDEIEKEDSKFILILFSNLHLITSRLSL